MGRHAESDNKGRLAERIAARLHAGPGVIARTRVRLPSTRGGTRRHEIDVLLTANAAGYEIQIPIECKNQSSPVGKADIESFVTKLRTVGLSERLGIYISVSGFTAGARDTAEHWGVRLFVLKGLSDDRISEVVYQATQSVVYLLLKLISCSVWDEAGQERRGSWPLFLRSHPDHYLHLGDLIRHLWAQHGKHLPMGKHQLRMVAPPGIYHYESIDSGQEITISRAEAIVGTAAIVVASRGQATNTSLVDAFTKKIDRGAITWKAPWDTGVRIFDTESALERYLSRLPGIIHMTVGRIPLPRILWNGMLWPLSERVREELHRLTDDGNSPEGLGDQVLESYASLFESEAEYERATLPAGACDWEIDIDPVTD